MAANADPASCAGAWVNDLGSVRAMCRATDILSRPTPVLNRSWQPIHLTTVARPLVMLWNDSANVVDPEESRVYS
jgi:hypothetical protein